MSGTDVPEDECIAVWCAGEDWCEVTCAMNVIGKKWHPVIVDRLLDRGVLRFNELSNEIGGITNKVLSESLDDLEEKGLLDRTIVNEKPVKVEYSLTDRGRSVEPVIEALRGWGQSQLCPAENESKSVC
jgi:DNA-binding HxlR family transcriptional regulator